MDSHHADGAVVVGVIVILAVVIAAIVISGRADDPTDPTGSQPPSQCPSEVPALAGSVWGIEVDKGQHTNSVGGPTSWSKVAGGEHPARVHLPGRPARVERDPVEVNPSPSATPRAAPWDVSASSTGRCPASRRGSGEQDALAEARHAVRVDGGSLRGTLPPALGPRPQPAKAVSRRTSPTGPPGSPRWSVWWNARRLVLASTRFLTTVDQPRPPSSRRYPLWLQGEGCVPAPWSDWTFRTADSSGAAPLRLRRRARRRGLRVRLQRTGDTRSGLVPRPFCERMCVDEVCRQIGKSFSRWAGERQFALLRIRPAAHRRRPPRRGSAAGGADQGRAALAAAAVRPAGRVCRQVMVRDNISRWRKHRLESRDRPGRPADRQQRRPASDRQLMLATALASLTPDQRAVIVLRFYDDLTERQTADAMGVALGTVKSQTHLALRRLREAAPESPSCSGRRPDDHRTPLRPPRRAGRRPHSRRRRRRRLGRAQRTRERRRLAATGGVAAAVIALAVGVAVVDGPDPSSGPRSPPRARRRRRPARTGPDTTYAGIDIFWSPTVAEEADLPWYDGASPLPRTIDLAARRTGRLRGGPRAGRVRGLRRQLAGPGGGAAAGRHQPVPGRLPPGACPRQAGNAAALLPNNGGTGAGRAARLLRPEQLHRGLRVRHRHLDDHRHPGLAGRGARWLGEETIWLPTGVRFAVDGTRLGHGRSSAWTSSVTLAEDALVYGPVKTIRGASRRASAWPARWRAASLSNPEAIGVTQGSQLSALAFARLGSRPRAAAPWSAGWTPTPWSTSPAGRLLAWRVGTHDVTRVAGVPLQAGYGDRRLLGADRSAEAGGPPTRLHS